MDERIRKAGEKYCSENPFTIRGFHKAEVSLIFSGYYAAFEAGARAAIKIIQAEIDKSEGDIDFLAFKIDALASDGTEGGT